MGLPRIIMIPNQQVSITLKSPSHIQLSVIYSHLYSWLKQVETP